jgi:predicted DNA-binding WGR domain protein
VIGSDATAPDADAPSSSSPQLQTPFSFKHISQYFDSLAAQSHNNPDHLLTLPQFPRVALESPSSSGGKFWLGVAMETGISVRWGKLGTNGTVKHIPLSQCRARNPSLELKRRILQKLDSGYDVIPHETILP